MSLLILVVDDEPDVEVLFVSSSGATYALTASQWNLRSPPLWPFGVSRMQATARSF